MTAWIRFYDNLYLISYIVINGQISCTLKLHNVLVHCWIDGKIQIIDSFFILNKFGSYFLVILFYACYKNQIIITNYYQCRTVYCCVSVMPFQSTSVLLYQFTSVPAYWHSKVPIGWLLCQAPPVHQRITLYQETIILRERNSALMSVRCSWWLRLFLATSPSRAQGSQTKELKVREQTVPSARTSKIKFS